MAIDSKKFRETPKIHEEIVELEKKLAEKKKELAEKKEVEKPDKEIIKEVLKEKTEMPQAPKVKPTAVPSSVIKTTKRIKAKSKERQVQLLTDLAFEKGVIHATGVAKGLDDPYILDEFHDTLVDELYDYLIKQGKLKQL